MLRGRSLGVAPEFSTTAGECLSRAVKLEPGLVEGWNTLGEQYWKKGDLTTAKTCFTGALQQVSNKNTLIMCFICIAGLLIHRQHESQSSSG